MPPDANAVVGETSEASCIYRNRISTSTKVWSYEFEGWANFLHIRRLTEYSSARRLKAQKFSSRPRAMIHSDLTLLENASTICCARKFILQFRTAWNVCMLHRTECVALPDIHSSVRFDICSGTQQTFNEWTLDFFSFSRYWYELYVESCRLV